MYESILVPTDGSEHAKLAARHAFALADAFDSAVRVLSVADVDREAGPFDAGGASDEFVDRVEAESETAVEDVATLAPPGVAVESAVVNGETIEAILDAVDDYRADIVCMGTHGRSGISRLATGSVAERVVHDSPVPVLTAKADAGEQSTDYERVLIPTDGSDAADAAVDHGVAIAKAFDATVHGVHVVDINSLPTDPGMAGQSELLEGLESAGESTTDAVAERARENGLEAETAVHEGFPVDDLLAYVDDEAIDLVVMGTHGRSGLDHLVGSTTERVVRESPIPVVSTRLEAVNAADAAGAADATDDVDASDATDSADANR